MVWGWISEDAFEDEICNSFGCKLGKIQNINLKIVWLIFTWYHNYMLR